MGSIIYWYTFVTNAVILSQNIKNWKFAFWKMSVAYAEGMLSLCKYINILQHNRPILYFHSIQKTNLLSFYSFIDTPNPQMDCSVSQTFLTKHPFSPFLPLQPKKKPYRYIFCSNQFLIPFLLLRFFVKIIIFKKLHRYVVLGKIGRDINILFQNVSFCLYYRLISDLFNSCGKIWMHAQMTRNS